MSFNESIQSIGEAPEFIAKGITAFYSERKISEVLAGSLLRFTVLEIPKRLHAVGHVLLD